MKSGLIFYYIFITWAAFIAGLLTYGNLAKKGVAEYKWLGYFWLLAGINLFFSGTWELAYWLTGLKYELVFHYLIQTFVFVQIFPITAFLFGRIAKNKVLPGLATGLTGLLYLFFLYFLYSEPLLPIIISDWGTTRPLGAANQLIFNIAFVVNLILVVYFFIVGLSRYAKRRSVRGLVLSFFMLSICVYAAGGFIIEQGVVTGWRYQLFSSFLLLGALISYGLSGSHLMDRIKNYEKKP